MRRGLKLHPFNNSPPPPTKANISGDVADVLICPLSLTYDKTPEDSLTQELRVCTVDPPNTAALKTDKKAAIFENRCEWRTILIIYIYLYFITKKNPIWEVC